MNKLLIMLISILLILSGCSGPENGIGTLNLRVVEEPVQRGIAPDRDMATAGYEVELSSLNETTKRYEVSVTDPSLSIDLPSVKWKINVHALNADGVRIGYGESECTVKAGMRSECSVIVSEFTENGTLSLKLVEKGGNTSTYKAELYKSVIAEGKPVEELSRTLSFTGSASPYTLNASVAPGFYILKIKDESGKEWLTDSVRIVSGAVSSATIEINAQGQVDITVTDNIKSSPGMKISYSSSGRTGEEYTVSATVTNMENPVYAWYMDSVLIDNANGSTVSGVIPAEDPVHTFTCIAASGNVVWSESRKIDLSMKDFNGKYIGKTLPGVKKPEFWKIELNDGKMTYVRYYDGYTNVEETTDYTIMKSGDSYQITAVLYGYETVLSIREGGIIKDPVRVRNYYFHGDLDFEEFVSDPVWTEGYMDLSEKAHSKTVSNPEYGTFEVLGDYEKHNFVDGVCTQCGFDIDNNDYDKICSDFSLINRNIASSEAIRYLPGDLTLPDGAVVNDSAHFYYQKNRNSVNGANILLYVPHTLCERYVEANGQDGLDTSYVMKWYCQEILKLNIPNQIDRIDYNKIVDAIAGSEANLVNLDSLTVSSRYQVPKRTAVTRDLSILPETYSGWAIFDSYTKNDLMLGDGTPITDSSLCYISFDEDGYLHIWLPESVTTIFERAYKTRISTGDFFWRYMHIYYPGIKADGENSDWLAIARALVTEFRVPKIKDYLKYGY